MQYLIFNFNFILILFTSSIKLAVSGSPAINRAINSVLFVPD